MCVCEVGHAYADVCMNTRIIYGCVSMYVCVYPCVCVCVCEVGHAYADVCMNTRIIYGCVCM